MNNSFSTIQERTRRLAVLQTELSRMGFDADTEAAQVHMIRGACQILDCEASALIMIDEANPEWMIRKTLGKTDSEGRFEWIYQVNPLHGKGLIKECLRSGQALRVNALADDARFDPSSDVPGGLPGGQPVHSMLCAPLVINGEVLGALQALNRQDSEFEAYDQDLLVMIAALAANILFGVRLVQQLKVANADLEASRWELLGSRNRLRALFDNLPLELYIVDSEYKVAAINRSRAQRANRLPEAVVGQTCYQVLFDRSEPCSACRVGETLKSGLNTQRVEHRNDIRYPDEMAEWDIHTHPILNEQGQAAQAILVEQDMTESRRLENVLAQSEKLASLGQLAAGVAHEINNPLTAIIANAQILRRELPAKDDLQESVDLIARAGARAAQVVRNLLDFARKDDYHLGRTDLNETLHRAMDLIQHEFLSHGAKLEFNLASDLPSILASQDHLQSVWLNLLLNAIDSLDKTPGEVKVTTSRVGNEIHVSVADNGKGVPADRLTRIFEPFYTTKAPGRGTGLGLSVCHRIIKQHGGHIGVESQVGVGTVFTVVLPVN